MDLHFQLRKLKISTFKISEVENARPSPVRIRRIAMGRRASIEHNFPPFMDEASIQCRQRDLALESLETEIVYPFEETMLFRVNEL